MPSLPAAGPSLAQGPPPGAPPYAWFVAALAATVVLLALDIWSGKTGRRRAHICLVAVTVPVLGLAIWLAEWVGSYWKFPPLPLRIHLSFAYAASAGALVAVVSGLMHLFRRVSRRAHARLAWLFVALALCAVATGVVIFLVGERKH